jgi:hypothetical protein
MAEFNKYIAFDHLPVDANAQAVGEGALASVSSTNPSTVGVALFGGRRWMRCNSSGSYDEAVPPLKDLVAGQRAAVFSATAAMAMDFRTAAGASIVSLYRATGNLLEVRQGASVLGRATRDLSVERYIEMRVRLSGAGADSVHLRVDGTDELILTGLNLGSTPISAVRRGSALYTTDCCIREAPAEGSPFYGPILMRLLRPVADVSTQWARNGGTSNAGRLADPNGSDFDATYVESQTLGEIDEYTLEQLPPDVNSIIAVVDFSVSTAPAGGAPQIRRSLQTSAGTVAGPEQTVGVGGWRTQMHVRPEKPGGGGWSRASVNELHLLRESV